MTIPANFNRNWMREFIFFHYGFRCKLKKKRTKSPNVTQKNSLRWKIVWIHALQFLIKAYLLFPQVQVQFVLFLC